MIRIITTFNEELYAASGRALLQSISTHLPGVEVLVYEELSGTRLDVPTVPIAGLPEFEAVRDRNRDVIGAAAGSLEPYNRRWFGWFRKVVAQHDALVRRPFTGYTLFLDADVRVMAPFDAELIRAQLRLPVGMFRGDRESIESGVIFHDGTQPAAAEFARRYMALYLGGAFRRLPVWADNYVMMACAEAMPGVVQDLAAGCRATRHRNSNGHETGGQILPQTSWGRYLEHDKGLHWRQGLVAAPHAGTAGAGGP